MAWNYRSALGPLLVFFMAGCSSLHVDEQDLERITHQEEYEESLSIEFAETEGLGEKIREDLDLPPEQEKPPVPKPPEKKVEKKPAKPDPAPEEKEKSVSSPEKVKSEPAEEEESVQQMPFRIGERVVFSLRYFGLRAGDLGITTLPMKVVNDEIAYHFKMDAVSNRSFAFVYTVDDYAETFVGVKGFRPFNYLIKMEQKDRVGENKALFDWETLTGYTWERAITKKGEEKKDYEWQIQEGSQNVISALFYLRTLDLDVGKSFQIPVAHRGKNLDMTVVVEKKEALRTSFGRINTVVLVPTFELDGAFKQVGDIRVWLTDDDQKLPVQIQAKIKIGTINAHIKSIERGRRL